MVVIDEATQALEAVSLSLPGRRGSLHSAYLLGLLDPHFQSQEIDSSWRSDATSSYDTLPRR